MIRLTLSAILLVTFLTTSAIAGNCHQFFVHHPHHGYAVQQVVKQNIFYSVGDSLVQEAKIAREVEKQLALRLNQQAPQQQQVGGIIATKCARCHSGDSPKGGIDLTGDIDDATFRRSLEILAGKDVPEGMKGVMAGLKEGDHAALMEAMLSRKPTGTLR